MPIPVFEQPISNSDTNKLDSLKVSPSNKKPAVPGLAVFLMVILVFLMIFTVESGLKDTNQRFNPSYLSCHQKKTVRVMVQNYKKNPNCNLEHYEWARLVLHLDLVFPIFVFGMLLLYIYRKANPSIYYWAFKVSLEIFLVWLALRSVAEIEYFLLKHHFLYGKYVLLLTMMAITAGAIILVQKKHFNKTGN